MNGQWIGLYSGTNSGTIVIDLDEAGATYQGIAIAYEDGGLYPRTFAFIEIPKGQSQFSANVGLQYLERGTNTFLTPADVATRFPSISIAKTAAINFAINATSMSIQWTTDIGTNGTAQVLKSEAGNASTLTALPTVQTWEDFNALVRQLEPYQFAFRGHHSNGFKLRTAFHRTGRANLIKFMMHDVNSLQRHLSGLTTHRFNLNDSLDYAAFLNLVQHHGYPTPMLDWTQSPFVAAYFAFRDVRVRQIDTNDKVRIFVLDSRAWNTLERATVLSPGFLHLTLLEPLAINNPRALPQQSISAVTNIDDIEKYVAEVSAQTGVPYLRAIDLPASQRKTVMQDLALMGITAGSLFPGLDGACQQLKERYFDL